MARARAAQPAWAALSFDERGAYMQSALRILLESRDEFITEICDETGRSTMETLFMEIFSACDSLNYYSRRAKKILKDRTVGLHLLKLKRAKILYRPLGVVGVISPWNGPFILSLNPTVQALMAGNAVIVKPSEVTPRSSQLVATLFERAGLPDGVVHVLQGDGRLGAALIDGGVDKISFTGSVATGRKVGAACGHNLIPCTLELGGKDAMVVCADADIDRAIGGAVFGGFMNNGQFCAGTERVYVVESVADRFIDGVVAKAKTVRIGPGDGDGSVSFDLGPFIFDRQIQIVERHMDDAITKGATVRAGGKRHDIDGRIYFEPTVLTDVTHDMLIMSEETFGPIIPIVRCKDEAEAVRMANDSQFGLSGGVWTKSDARAEQLAKQLETGSICVNDSSLTYGALEVPFGGRKNSGVGYANGEAGLRGYCHQQSVLFDRFGLKEEQVWYPYDADKQNILIKSLKWIFGTPLRWLIS